MRPTTRTKTARPTSTTPASRRATDGESVRRTLDARDDSGLELAALDGRPGSRPRAGRRGATSTGSWPALERARRPERPATWPSSSLLAPDGARTARHRHSRGGDRHSKPAGEGGFGFDPVFVPTRRNTHRRRAGRRMESAALASRPRRASTTRRHGPRRSRRVTVSDTGSRVNPRTCGSQRLWNVRHTFRPVSDTGRGPFGPVPWGTGAGESDGRARRACHQLTSAPRTITFAIT